MLVGEKGSQAVKQIEGYIAENENNYPKISFNSGFESYNDETDYRGLDFKKLPSDYIVWMVKP